MKALKVFVLTVALAYLADTLFAEQPGQVSGSASLGLLSKYVFRGYELSSKSAVIQPALSISYKGFSAGFWGNIDTDEHKTQSFIPDSEGHKSFNEVDLTLSYTYTLNKLSFTGGYIYYGTKYASETEEVFVSLAYDTFLKPSLSVYRDINKYRGTYFNLSISHSLPLCGNTTLDLGASAGYFAGDADCWRTYEVSTGDYTGRKYRALHDGMVKAGLTIQLTKNLSVQPVAQYWFPLSGKAKRTIGGNPYNPNGNLDNTFVAGINAAFSF